MGLPKVRKEIVDVFYRDFQRRTEEGTNSQIEFIEAITRRLVKENPEIYILTKRLETIYGERAPLIKVGMLQMYDILRRASETSDLEESS